MPLGESGVQRRSVRSQGFRRFGLAGGQSQSHDSVPRAESSETADNASRVQAKQVREPSASCRSSSGARSVHRISAMVVEPHGFSARGSQHEDAGQCSGPGSYSDELNGRRRIGLCGTSAGSAGRRVKPGGIRNLVASMKMPASPPGSYPVGLSDLRGSASWAQVERSPFFLSFVPVVFVKVFSTRFPRRRLCRRPRMIAWASFQERPVVWIK